MDTAVCIKSYEVALRAVGGSIALCDEIMNGNAIHGFGTLRPPGHHAEYDYAAGFCIFNNIAIAAKYLQNKYSIKKIAIIDWDVHHGNGTQHSFEKDDTVLYISLHQFPHYPGTGSKHETGKSKGKGFTLNFPMPAGSGDREYLDIFNMEIIPALISFKPEVILISAGFDAHKSDPLSSIKLSTETYGTFTKMLIDVADTFSEGRIIGLLEGGYNLNILGECVNEVISAFVNH
jgi:acetoin utilization deacetylase AcuC-like enzyme